MVARDEDTRGTTRAQRGTALASAQLPARIVVGEPPSQRRWTRGTLASDRRVLIVGEAETAPAAVAVTLSEQPHLCLLGTTLQGSAIAAVWEIASRLPATTVVMLADSLDPRDFFAAIRAGATSYLVRTMDPRRLVPALLDVRSGKPAIPRSLVALLVSEYRDHGPRRRALVPPLPGVDLTSREWEVLDLLGKGCDTGEIAQRLHVTRATVRSHRAAAWRKVGGPCKSH